jgi:hypothetical protein
MNRNSFFLEDPVERMSKSQKSSNIKLVLGILLIYFASYSIGSAIKIWNKKRRSKKSEVTHNQVVAAIVTCLRILAEKLIDFMRRRITKKMIKQFFKMLVKKLREEVFDKAIKEVTNFFKKGMKHMVKKAGKFVMEKAKDKGQELIEGIPGKIQEGLSEGIQKSVESTYYKGKKLVFPHELKVLIESEMDFSLEGIIVFIVAGIRPSREYDGPDITGSKALDIAIVDLLKYLGIDEPIMWVLNTKQQVEEHMDNIIVSGIQTALNLDPCKKIGGFFIGKSIQFAGKLLGIGEVEDAGKEVVKFTANFGDNIFKLANDGLDLAGKTVGPYFAEGIMTYMDISSSKKFKQYDKEFYDLDKELFLGAHKWLDDNIYITRYTTQLKRHLFIGARYLIDYGTEHIHEVEEFLDDYIGDPVDNALNYVDNQIKQAPQQALNAADSAIDSLEYIKHHKMEVFKSVVKDITNFAQTTVEVNIKVAEESISAAYEGAKEGIEAAKKTVDSVVSSVGDFFKQDFFSSSKSREKTINEVWSKTVGFVEKEVLEDIFNKVIEPGFEIFKEWNLAFLDVGEMGVELVEDMFNEGVKFAEKFWNDPISTSIQAMKDTVKALGQAADATEEAITDAWDWSSTASKDAWDWSSTAKTDIQDWTKNAQEDTRKWTRQAAKDAFNFGMKSANGAIKWTSVAIPKAFDWANNAGKDVENWVDNAGNDVADFASDNAKKVFGYIEDVLNDPKAAEEFMEDTIEGAVDDALDFIGDTFNDIGDFIEGAFDEILDVGGSIVWFGGEVANRAKRLMEVVFDDGWFS